jgi:hypothetical protein
MYLAPEEFERLLAALRQQQGSAVRFLFTLMEAGRAREHHQRGGWTPGTSAKSTTWYCFWLIS